MSGIEEKNVLQNIRGMYDQIFQAEKRVADFILKHPDQAVNANVSELANYSGVSDATVIRMCKHLGYEGYYQMRICLSRDIGRRQQFRKKAVQANPSVSEYFKAMANSVLTAGEAMDHGAFKQSVECIRKSSMVHLVATGNTSPLCLYCGFRLERIGIRASYNLQPEHYMNHINLAQPSDVVLAISWSGTSRSVVQALSVAKEKGLKTIAVTGFEHSPLSQKTDHLLLSAVGDGGYENRSQYSRLGEMVILEALIQALTDKVPQDKDEIAEAELLLSETKF